MGDLQPVGIPGRGPQKIQPLLHGERITLRRIAADRHNQAVEHFQSALDHPEVTVGGRIEGTGVNRSAHGGSVEWNFRDRNPYFAVKNKSSGI